MNWIRIAATIGDDPAIARIGVRLGRDTSGVVGGVVLLLCQLPAHAREGSIADVPDALLETWARWRGKRGAFAQAFRAELCTPEGVVRAWEKYNGAAMREADRKRVAVKKWREDRRRTDTVADNVSATLPPRNPLTGRDVTGRTTSTLQDQLPARVARREKTPANPNAWPLCPVETSTAMCDRWRAKIGAATTADFRAAVAPAFSADRQLSPGEAAEVVSYYAWKKDRNYQRIADFASSLWSWVDAYRAAQREDGAA